MWNADRHPEDADATEHLKESSTAHFGVPKAMLESSAEISAPQFGAKMDLHGVQSQERALAVNMHWMRGGTSVGFRVAARRPGSNETHSSHIYIFSI